MSVFDLDALLMSLREPLVRADSPRSLIVDLMLAQLSLSSRIANWLLNSLTLIVDVLFKSTCCVLLDHALQALQSMTGGVVLLSLRLEWVVL